MAERGTFLLAALLTACAANAHAQALDVQGDDCIDENALRSALARYTREPAQASELRAEVQSEPREASLRVWRGDVIVVDRRFEWKKGTVCEARVKAVAIALALAIEGEEGMSAAEEASTTTGTTTTTTTSTTTTTGTGTSTSTTTGTGTTDTSTTAGTGANTRTELGAGARDGDREEASDHAAEGDDAPAGDEGDGSEPLQVRLELGAGVLIGVLPEPGALGLVGAEIEVASGLTVGLVAFGTLPTESPRLGGAIHAHVLGGRGAACLAYELFELHVSACAGVLAGVVRARGEGFAVRDARSDLGFIAALAGGLLDLPIFKRFSLRAALFAALPLVRPELRVGTPSGDSRVAYTSAQIDATASVALLWALR
jgi:hypothetical protein